MSDIAVEVKNVRKVYGHDNTEVVALAGATFSVRGGEVVALLGPSGAGKSTLLNILGLVTAPTTGTVVIGGISVVEGPRELVNVRAFRRQHIGFVFQKANLIAFLTAVENVQLAMEINDLPRGEARRRALELLKYFSVDDCANRRPAELSGGQQQRIAVARALANKPGLILADEPTAALDRERGRQVMELFARIAHEQGAAVIVVTHDHRALEVFDRQLEMEDGELKPSNVRLSE